MERSKYEKTIEGLIDDLEITIEQCKAVLVQDITADMTEDKMHNVLKGKRAAAEDAVYYAKQIDLFEKELSSDFSKEEKEPVNKNPLKRHTKK